MADTDTQRFGDGDSVEIANAMNDYLIKNEIVKYGSSAYKTLTNDMKQINEYQKNDENENATQKANELISIMEPIILKDDNDRLIKYTDIGLDKLSSANDISENMYYKNILEMTEQAKALTENDEFEKSSIILASVIMEMKQYFDIFMTMPQTYTVVRRNNSRTTDSFWNISSYDFIYADTQKWQILYEKNKGKIRDENNPRLISPGLVFNIPSIMGEQREGLYKSSETYIPMTVYYYYDNALVIEEEVIIESYTTEDIVEDDSEGINQVEEYSNEDVNAENYQDDTSNEAEDDESGFYNTTQGQQEEVVDEDNTGGIEIYKIEDNN